MYRALHGDLDLACRVAVCPSDMNLVFRQREKAYQDGQAYLLGRGGHPDLAGDRHDHCAYTVICELDGEVVASCRWIPATDAEYPLSELYGAEVAARHPPAASVEISRVLVRPDLRGRGLSDVLLYNSSVWLAANTGFTHYYAVCIPKLAEFYRHMGAGLLSPRGAAIPGRGAREYLAVQGTLRGSSRALAEHLCGQGWTLGAPPSPPAPAVVARPEGDHTYAFTSVNGAAVLGRLVLRERDHGVLVLAGPGAWISELADRVDQICAGAPPAAVVLEQEAGAAALASIRARFPAASIQRSSRGEGEHHGGVFPETGAPAKPGLGQGP